MVAALPVTRCANTCHPISLLFLRFARHKLLFSQVCKASDVVVARFTDLSWWIPQVYHNRCMLFARFTRHNLVVSQVNHTAACCSQVYQAPACGFLSFTQLFLWITTGKSYSKLGLGYRLASRYPNQVDYRTCQGLYCKHSRLMVKPTKMQHMLSKPEKKHSRCLVNLEKSLQVHSKPRTQPSRCLVNLGKKPGRCLASLGKASRC